MKSKPAKVVTWLECCQYGQVIDGDEYHDKTCKFYIERSQHTATARKRLPYSGNSRQRRKRDRRACRIMREIIKEVLEEMKKSVT